MATVRDVRERGRGKEEEEREGRRETEEEEETLSAKQDFQSRAVIGCGISIIHHRTSEMEGKED